MSWSERFAAHLSTRGISQLDAVIELRAVGVRATQSQAHYWCRGSVPRLATREQIAIWSKGDVPAEAVDVPLADGSSGSVEAEAEADESGDHATGANDSAKAAG